MDFYRRNIPIGLYSFLGIILTTTAFAQAQTTSQDRMYNTYDQMVGLDNTGLFNGTEFTDLFLNTDGSYRYLKGFDYAEGSVVYKEQYYVNVPLKYDLLEDNLLARSNDNLSIFNIRLIPEFVSEFTLHGLHFVTLEGFGKSGFFEQAFQGDFMNLYIKHKKKMRSKALRSGVQYRFKRENNYLIKYKETYLQIETVREIPRELPTFKTEIKSFYHRFRSLYKQDRDEFMKKLISYLDTLKQDTPKREAP